MNYAVAHPNYGYTQGMSDLLAPVLAEVQHEADAYWCFVGLMQKTIFVSSPKDIDMDNQLVSVYLSVCLHRSIYLFTPQSLKLKGYCHLLEQTGSIWQHLGNVVTLHKLPVSCCNER